MPHLLRWRRCRGRIDRFRWGRHRPGFFYAAQLGQPLPQEAGLGLRLGCSFPGCGKLLARWGTGIVVRKSTDGKETNPTLFVAPHTIAVDSKGDLYIGEVVMTMGGVDRGSRTIQKFARIS